MDHLRRAAIAAAHHATPVAWHADATYKFVAKITLGLFLVAVFVGAAALRSRWNARHPVMHWTGQPMTVADQQWDDAHPDLSQR